jgi:hypothetical protein
VVIFTIKRAIVANLLQGYLMDKRQVINVLLQGLVYTARVDNDMNAAIGMQSSGKIMWAIILSWEHMIILWKNGKPVMDGFHIWWTSRYQCGML